MAASKSSSTYSMNVPPRNKELTYRYLYMSGGRYQYSRCMSCFKGTFANVGRDDSAPCSRPGH